MSGVMIYLIGVNLVGFMIMGYDKSQARKRGWRVSEMTLLAVAFFGGALGTLVGMKVFHHKTKHFQFKYGVPLMLAFNCVGYYLLLKQGL